MSISNLTHHLEPDGSLVVDLGRYGGVVKYGPLSTGMDWAQLDDGLWVPAECDHASYHDAMTFIETADRRPAESPVGRYLSAIPERDLEALRQFWLPQATLLKLYVCWPEARELLWTNPALLWLVSATHYGCPDQRDQLHVMLRQGQRELLAWILGRPVRQAQVKFLKKLIVASGDFQDLRVTMLCAGDSQFVKRLVQWPTVPCCFLILMLDEPAVTRFEWLRREFAGERNRADTVRLMHQRRRLLFDTMRLLELADTGGAEARADFRHCGSAVSLQRLHDRLIMEAQRRSWPKLLNSDNPRARAFPEPPILSDERFQAISSVAGLVQEADAMQNCVALRAGRAMVGACAIYRVYVAGERGTLEVSVGRHGEPVSIDEFKLATNEEPSEAAWSAARDWLEWGRKEWMRRNAGS
jgi:hypothetical protein